MTRVQKKVLGKMANKNSIKFVVDENVAAVLDDFYKWAKVLFYRVKFRQNSFFQIELESKSKADKLVKDIIKIIVKTGVLFHNKQIPEAEIKNWEILRSKIINILMTVTYFHSTPFTYNGEMLSKQFESEEKLLQDALKVRSEVKAKVNFVQGHVTDKTLGRVEHVFGFLKSRKHLDSFFSETHAALRDDLCKKLQIVQEKDAI